MATNPNLLNLTAEIVKAHVEANSVPADQLPMLVSSVHDALAGLGQEPQPTTAPNQPDKEVGAVSVRKSLADPNHIISLLDGKPYKALKRHLTKHGLTPEAYRERFGLKPDYPMIAPAYSTARSALAKTLGLGRKAEANRPHAETAVARKRDLKTPAERKTGSRKSLSTALGAAKKLLKD